MDFQGIWSYTIARAYTYPKVFGISAFLPSPLSMESSAILTPSQLPYLFPSKSNKKKAYPSWPCSKPRTSQPTRLHCQKMYVPGGYSPFISMLCVSNIYLSLQYIRHVQSTNSVCVKCLCLCVCVCISYEVNFRNWMQDLEKHHQKLREPKTSTISLLTLQ